MKFEYINKNSTMTFYFRGKLNYFSIDSNKITDLVKGAVCVVFDLEHVDYVSSDFMTLCMLVSKIVGIKQFSVINVNDFSLKVFNICGLKKLLNIYPKAA
jgi:hypothetical protein